MATLYWEMPGSNGVNICRNVRERKGQPYIYTLLLGSSSGALSIAGKASTKSRRWP